MTDYVELHCHSYFSFQEGASSIEELVLTAKELGYAGLALTDHDNLCGAMRFAKTASAFDLKPIIGAEVSLTGGHHLTLLAATTKGYNNLCRLLSHAHVSSARREPQLDSSLISEHSEGLIALSGCSKGEVPKLLMRSRWTEARRLARQYREWFGQGNFYLELQQNLVYGDTERTKRLLALSKDTGIPAVATNNIHYHIRERHRLQDALVAIRECKTLDDTHRERRPNSEFFLKSTGQMSALFAGCPEAIENTVKIAERCSFNLATDLNYQFPDYPVPEGYNPGTYLEKLCYEAAVRRYGTITPKVKDRLDEEFRLVHKHDLDGFFLIYHDILVLGKEVAVDLGLASPDTPLEEEPPGRSRGSSVALLIGYLIGLSHIDPIKYNLSLERFLHEDLSSVPDVDLDFARNIREELIKRVHQRWGWEHAALTGMIDTYQAKGAVRDLGKALGLPAKEVDKLAKGVEHHSARDLAEEMLDMPGFKDKVVSPVWRHLTELAYEIDGFPKYLAQHPGGMGISSKPLSELVPIQKGAIDGRYIIQWDKDSIDDAGFVKIDFLALGALSQMQECVQLIDKHKEKHLDLSRIDFDDQAVYEMLWRGDTIGIFQVESAAQLQTITRIRPKDLVDMAIEVALVRPGVGATNSTHIYLERHLGKEPVTYDHPLCKRALERTLGAIVFQDQVNQLAIDVAGFSSGEADQLRRAFSRRNNTSLLKTFWEKFRDGAAKRGVSGEIAGKIFSKFSGEYMFPESHAYAFGVTAYQAAWLKYHYPLEFYVSIMNQQPMGFYNMETLKEDAKRHGVRVLNPDINLSLDKSIIEDGSVRLGFRNVRAVGEAAAEIIVEKRAFGGPYTSLGDFMERAGLLREAVDNLVDAGVFDCFEQDRRALKWEVGLRYRPVNQQLALPLPVEQDRVALPKLTDWETMHREYRTLGLHPKSHAMAYVREDLGADVHKSIDILGFKEGTEVKVAGLVIRRQRPRTSKGVVFLSLEDEHGHISLIVWPAVYQKHRNDIKNSFLLAHGTVSRRDGTLNVVVDWVKPLGGIGYAPKAKNWG
ncbi:MAG: DNA polymerase III subunit alpha [Dehalococcoidia bacterium]|nr:DNA polymerase III subunit alpha [Dehalococcoidia bacterium]